MAPLLTQFTRRTAVKAFCAASAKRDAASLVQVWTNRGAEAAPVIALAVVTSSFVGFLIARAMHEPQIDFNIRMATARPAPQDDHDNKLWNESASYPAFAKQY
ncbi:hypothetical protein BASA81_003139 [Batrachochytrium salamandrivorans]|nr:hypothetical protein BASA81_003139 [Batrachochytrium salamandrivorans]